MKKTEETKTTITEYKAPIRYCISKGYIKITLLSHDGKVEEPGGFVEDWIKGRLWVLIDLEKNMITDGDFSYKRLIERIYEKLEKTGDLEE